ncbi:hypothetical protein B0H10DRAFT_2013537, partial [Mycena sp. CBHHK59/15]
MFLVSGVLFKLHKLFLSRDPESMFRDMFNLPQGSSPQTMDPIPLSNDSADEFRALCWVVYAFPHEIQLQNTPDADMPRLVNVARMCQKYSLPLFENWALGVIRSQCESEAGLKFGYLDTCPQAMLDRIMALGTLCGDHVLLGLVEMGWSARLRSGELNCSDALVSGENHARRQFLGDVYYELNKRIHSSNLSPALGFSDLGLTDKQLLSLLCGHVLISKFWKQLRQKRLVKRGTCNPFAHSAFCSSAWSKAFPSSSIEDTSDVRQNLTAATASVLQVIPILPTNSSPGGFCARDYLFEVNREFSRELPWKYLVL